MQRNDTKASKIKSCGKKKSCHQIAGYRSLTFQTDRTIPDGNWQGQVCGKEETSKNKNLSQKD